MREERCRELIRAHKDLITAARILLLELQLHAEPLGLAETSSFIVELHAMPASIERVQRLASRLATLHPFEGETLIKLLTGDLRLGIDPPLVVEAIASAFGVPPGEITSAISLTNDPGETAVLARCKRLAEAVPAPCEPSTAPPAPATRDLPLS